MWITFFVPTFRGVCLPLPTFVPTFSFKNVFNLFILHLLLICVKLLIIVTLTDKRENSLKDRN